MESSSSEFPATAARLTSNLFDARDLPWISRRDRTNFMVHDCYIDGKPGEFVIRTLFTEFTYLAEKKIDSVLSSEPLEKPISKSLQRGEDVIFDQLLTAFGSVGEHCLPSLLKTLFAWYDKQMASTSDYLEAKGLKATLTEAQSKGTNKSNSSAGDAYEKSEQLYLLEKRDLAVEFIFCLFLIEVLKRLPLHPGHEDLVNYIENLAFKHFRFREGTQNNPNIQNINIIADLYAEVIGVLAQARFQSVRKRFMSELKELRNREPSVMTTHSIINLLMGMKFFRIKMVPIEQFEASFEFMHECAHYFMEVKDKDIKHALAGLFVEILVPVAATVKNEVNVPCLKNFVEMLYPMTLDLCVKKKHTLALFPLVTCLLCVSQKQFFLKNWHCFLSMCLSHLKNRDNKMSRAAFESLYRLLWVYMIRIKCESNTATQSKLQSIVYSLFPKGSKAVVPRDTPLNIFVKIIQFIAQGRLDFAMKGIVYDLLSVDRPIKVILAPERMSIGLRAFLVIADSLQQKEGEPPMPRTAGVMPSGNTLRVKKTFLNKLLTEKMAKNIGVNEYYPHVRKALNDILRALDLQFGKPLMMTTVQNANKEPDDMISGERKPKIDLFRACIAAVPRLIPDGMSRPDLIDLLSRLTVHMDEELRGLAFQALQNIINDFPDWREEVIEGFMNFMLSEINDTFPQLLDNALRMFLQLLTCWKTSIQSCPKASPESSANKSQRSVIVLHRLEAVCLVMLSSCRQPTRRIAAQLLKEARVFLKLLPYCDDLEEPVLDVIDKIRSSVLETCLPYIPANEKATIISSSFSVDLQWLAERNGRAWLASTSDNSETTEEGRSFCEAGKKDEIKMNAWSALMTAFMSEVSKLCTTATFYCWSLVCQRMNSLFTHIDTISMNDNRASVLLRGAASNIKKSTTDRDSYLALWKNYLMLACSIAPSSSQSNSLKHISHDLSSSPDSMTSERSTENKSPLNRGMSAASMFGQILPHLKSEHVDLRNATIFGLSHVNPYAVKELMEELIPYIREAIDRNKENNRKRKARDTLRVQLGILLELMAERKIFGVNLASLDREADGLNSTFVEYIDGMRLHLENEMDKENALTQEIRTRFCGFLTHLIKSFPLENRHNLFTRDLRNNLFNLLAPWSGKYSHSLNEHKSIVQSNQDYDLEFVALSAMSSLICCGPVFDDACLSSEESNIYAWLSSLLSSKEERVQKIGHETLVLLLEFNPDVGYLLDWCVDCCYSQNVAVADQCFTAIATIFSLRDYPCDHYMAILNLTLMNTSCPRASVQETAFHLLQVLDYRFFGAGKKLDLNFENEKADKTPTNFDRILENDDSEYPDYLGEVMLRKKNKEEYKSFEPLVIGNFPINQFKLSQRMAKLHADITMPLFSEITFRLRVARPSICRNMLSYLKPWLADIELVDSFTYSQGNPVSSEYDIPCNQMCDENIPKGWGCAEATEMILNNLFYLTVKSGGDYPEEIEELWYCLCHKFTNNMRVIIRYLFIVTSLSPTEILPHAKRVVLYMARARPERLIDEMMIELQTVEYLNCSIERTETPPFFRVTARKENGHSEEGTFTVINCEGNNKISSHLEQGTLHTKRHSTESGLGGVMTHSDNIPQTGPTGALSNAHSSIINKSDRTSCINEDASVASFASITEESLMLLARIAESEVSQIPSRAPHPLPMPEFGGYYAPLTEFLPDNNQPVTTFHRCNLSLTFLCDIILDGLPIDWTPHVPIMLHIIFLGLDHPKPIVHEHCKQLLRNLLIVLCQHNDPLCIARSILNSKTEQLDYDLLVPPAISQPVPNFTEPTLNQGLCIADCSRHNTIQRGFKMPSSLSLNDLLKDTWSCGSDDSSDNSSNNCSSLDPELSQTMDLELLAKCLVHYLSSKRGPLWNCEDITAKVWSVRSAAQLTFFLDHVLIAFKEFLVRGRIEERWAEIALQLALSCSSRHYAGRSLQIFRAIKLPVNSRMLADILSRLVETVAEQGEDMQGYVTELMLTLESAVDSLDSERKVICEYVKSLFKPSPSISIEANKLNSNPPLSSNPSQATITSNSCPNSNFIMNRFENSQNHARSVSFTTNLNGKRLPLGSPVAGNREMRLRSNTETDLKVSNRASLDLNIGRSRSAQVLKSAEERVLTPEDRISLLSQLFWISVAMLETDYEHEFLLALRLMARILSRLPLDRNDSQEKIEKVMLQSKWTNFPGVHAMLLKGCTSVSTFKMTMVLLHKMTPFLEYSFIDPSETTDSFPFNVIAMLPYMLASYDDPNPLCIQSSKTFADWCTKKLDNLENLATIMTLYSKKSFSKQSFQWTKCVVKYLFDAYSHVFPSIVSFLVEVMDRGPPSLSSHILSILQCILHYMDIATSSYSLKSDLHRIAHKYIEGSQWKDALKILKLVVTRSSTLAAAPSYSTSNYSSMSNSMPYSSSTPVDTVSIASGASFADSDFGIRRELPGRTIEFTYELDQTPIIGRRYMQEEKDTQSKSESEDVKDEASLKNSLKPCEMKSDEKGDKPASSPRRSLSYNHSFNEGSHWKRPWLSQSRTRERLIGLLKSFGKSVGLPKSPSVIFSQNSDVVEKQSSMGSSTEDLSVTNNDASAESKHEENCSSEQFLAKEFDFLEDELESKDGDGGDIFNWGVLQRPTNLGDTPENDFRSGSPSQSGAFQNIPQKEDLSSDDDGGSVSPTYEGLTDLSISALYSSSS